MNNKTCAKCGSNRVMTDLEVRAGNLSPFVFGDMTWAGFPVGSSTFLATVCADCGYSEIYAKDPQAVWEEWRKKNT